MPDLILETGLVVDGANSYADQDLAEVYADNRGNADWAAGADEDKDAALIRATAAIDAKYRGRWPGYKVAGRVQVLEWPRQAAYDNEGNLIVGDEVPIEVINATIEAAFRELATPGVMLPDLARGGGIKRLKADTVEIEYAANAMAETAFTLIDGMLSGILSTGSGGGLFGSAVRG